jgi:hypothetical protein
MSGIALFNLGAWLFVARAAMRRPLGDESARRVERIQFALSFVFTVVCAFRSFLPRAEGQRIVLVDSWWSNAALGRSAATVAELCFMAQWSFLIFTLLPRGATGRRVAAWIPLLLIAIAEIFSWYTTLSTDFIGSVIEESLWLLGTLVCIVNFLWLLPELSKSVQRWLRWVILVGIGYALFLAFIDVPMYYRRWQRDLSLGHVALPVWEGLWDSMQRWVVTRKHADWYEEMPWMTLYFSVGVWMSIGTAWFAGRADWFTRTQVPASPTPRAPS